MFVRLREAKVRLARVLSGKLSRAGGPGHVTRPLAVVRSVAFSRNGLSGRLAEEGRYNRFVNAQQCQLALGEDRALEVSVRSNLAEMIAQFLPGIAGAHAHAHAAEAGRNGFGMSSTEILEAAGHVQTLPILASATLMLARRGAARFRIGDIGVRVLPLVGKAANARAVAQSLVIRFARGTLV